MLRSALDYFNLFKGNGIQGVFHKDSEPFATIQFAVVVTENSFVNVTLHIVARNKVVSAVHHTLELSPEAFNGVGGLLANGIKGWIARDLCGTVNLHSKKPVWKEDFQMWECGEDFYPIEDCLEENTMFPELNYYDNPIEVEITIKHC